MTEVYIYALAEVGSNEVRYVGQTVNPDGRLKAHLDDLPQSDNDSNAKRAWIRSIVGRGSEIVMSILEVCEVDTAVKSEQYWIDCYAGLGHSLTNTKRATRAFYGPRRDEAEVVAEQVSVRLNEAQKQMLEAYNEKYPALSRAGCFVQMLYEVNSETEKQRFDRIEATLQEHGTLLRLLCGKLRVETVASGSE